jgi:hypothetical protein
MGFEGKLCAHAPAPQSAAAITKQKAIRRDIAKTPGQSTTQNTERAERNTKGAEVYYSLFSVTSVFSAATIQL